MQGHKGYTRGVEASPYHSEIGAIWCGARPLRPLNIGLPDRTSQKIEARSGKLEMHQKGTPTLRSVPCWRRCAQISLAKSERLPGGVAGSSRQQPERRAAEEINLGRPIPWQVGVYRNLFSMFPAGAPGVGFAARNLCDFERPSGNWGFWKRE